MRAPSGTARISIRTLAVTATHHAPLAPEQAAWHQLREAPAARLGCGPRPSEAAARDGADPVAGWPRDVSWKGHGPGSAGVSARAYGSHPPAPVAGVVIAASGRRRSGPPASGCAKRQVLRAGCTGPRTRRSRWATSGGRAGGASWISSSARRWRHPRQPTGLAGAVPSRTPFEASFRVANHTAGAVTGPQLDLRELV
jgi:hypothetical protein